MLPDAESFLANLTVVHPTVLSKAPLKKKRRGLKTGRKLSFVTYRLAGVLGKKDRVEPKSVGLMASLVLLGDETTDMEKRKLMDGLGEHLPSESKVLQVFDELTERVDNPEFEENLKRTAEWQDLSLKQREDPGEERLEEITRNKGGYTFLSVLYLIEDDPDEKNRETFFDFGHFVQLCDDYTDRKRDEREGLSTLFTEGYRNLDDLKGRLKELEEAWKETYERELEVRRLFNLFREYVILSRLKNRPLLGILARPIL